MRRSHARQGVNNNTSKPTDDDMDLVKLQIRPSTRSNFFSRNPKQSSSTRSSILILFVAVAVAFVLCYLLYSGKASRNSNRYGIVIDGSSTGSRIHVFKYSVDGGSNSALFDFGKDGLASLRANPGLSAFAEDPKAGGGTLKELVEFAKWRIPKEQWGST